MRTTPRRLAAVLVSAGACLAAASHGAGHPSPPPAFSRHSLQAQAQAPGAPAAGTARPGERPGQAGEGHATLDATVLARLDALVGDAIDARQLPGAVLLAGIGDRVVWHKAYGQRAVEPRREPMTPDTVFDLASLTKVVATTTAVMILVEEGRIRLADRVAAYIPEFARYGKGSITIRHLLTHVSGLRPDIDVADEWIGYDTAIERAIEEVPQSAPNERFVYSDINFFLLGDIVRRVSGLPLERFCEERVFGPLGMRDTMFNPPAAMQPRIAPTERCPAGVPGCTGVLRGTVHDPTARRMGGVAGHAGVFSTAADLSRFCRMLLGEGRLGDTRILSPLSVLKMTSAATPAGTPSVRRGLGWDIDSSYSSNRGELLPVGSFGHTGFTGTSLWIDPLTGVYVVFLSNRVHPDGSGDVTPLRARIATVVASAVRPDRTLPLRAAEWTGADFGPAGPALPARTNEPVLAGIDVLRAEGFSVLRGRKVGLITNHTGRTRNGEATIDVLRAARDVQLVTLFSPEHGIRGILDENVPSTRDEKTGLTIHSLYGKTQRPTPEMLEGIDTLVIDLQDIGARFYTYMTTMAYAMEEAARRDIAVVVLDRPNPIDGFHIEGPTPPQDGLNYNAYFPMPIRHGLTMGELAMLFNAENRIGAKLTVVKMRNWRRDHWWDDTGLLWVNPSPNMRNMNQAALYPGIGAIEHTNVSVGRGTDTPFEQLGAPWIDGVRLAEALNARQVPGVRFYPVAFTPGASKYKDEPCQGVFLVVTDRQALRPVRLGIEVAATLLRLYPGTYNLDPALYLMGSRDVLERLRLGQDPARIAASWAAGEARWRYLRAKYLLY